ncbi:MAG: methyltransferase domain-containing protein [Rhodospirillales bacterium]|nr:methyltransferase domain-containing protein [Rhodospirillales bacterium]
MSRRDRRKQAKQGANRPPGTARRPAGVSDMLLRHAGQIGMPDVDFDALAQAAAAASKPGVDVAIGTLRRQEDIARKIAKTERALAHEPDSLALLLALAELQKQAGQRDAALATFRRCHALAPARGDIRHMVDALSGQAPARAADEYVIGQFDGIADKYDEKLRHWLDYKGPEIVHRAALAALGPNPPRQDILDLGCGTGLNAPLFKALARRLDGVDLAPRMIERAQARGLYDDLAADEIGRYLAATARRYTLALASDVLVYFGDLAPVFAGAFRVLLPGGLFVFTVEKAEGAPFRLAASGRYAHADDYVRRTASDAGLTGAAASDEVLRTEDLQPVHGRCYALRRPG